MLIANIFFALAGVSLLAGIIWFFWRPIEGAWGQLMRIKLFSSFYRKNSKNISETVDTSKSPGKDGDSTERIFTNVAPKYLVSLLVRDTSVHENPKAFIGKWMEIYGEVSDITSHRGSIHVTVTDDIGTEIYMIFRTEWIPGLVLSERKTIIKAIGKIKRVSITSVTLDDCELVEGA